MYTRRCECGQLLTDGGATAVNAVCPRCGRAVETAIGNGVHPSGEAQPAFGPPAAVHALPTKALEHPQGDNAEAVVGFIMAIMSFFTCMLLAPVAVFFSFRGLKKPTNQGLAVAGMVLGILQTIGLTFVIGYLLFVFLLVGGVSAVGIAAASTAKNRLQTDVALEHAKTNLTDYYVEEQSLPDAVRGNIIVSAHNDAWGISLRYVRNGQEEATITSAGPDREFATDDDISMRWIAAFEMAGAPDEQPVLPEKGTIARPVPHRNPTFVEQPSLMAEKPSILSVQEALAGIGGPASLNRESCLEFLRDAKPNDGERERVLRTVVPLVTEFRYQELSQAVVENWFAVEHAEIVRSQVASMQSSLELVRYGLPLLELLGEAGAEKELASLLTHRDAQIADAVAEIATRAGVPAEVLAEAAIAGLRQEDQTETALRYLKDAEPIETLRTQLNKNVVRWLADPVGFKRRQAVAVLTKWGVTSDSLEALAEAGEYDLVASLKDEQALRLLGKAFRDFPLKHSKAARILKEVGPAAEAYVWPALEDANLSVVLSACRLLADIGTEASVPHLEKLQQQRRNPAFRGVATLAIRSIREAKREPTTDWAN